MKYFWRIIFLIFLVACAKQRSHYRLIDTNDSPKAGHMSANEFEELIGRELKANYPSKIERCSATLELVPLKNRNRFRFTWWCNIVPSSREEADYYFTRRGAVFSGTTASAARKNAENEVRTSRKVDRAVAGFKRQYGNVTTKTLQSSAGRDSAGRYWHLTETFITAKRKE